MQGAFEHKSTAFTKALQGPVWEAECYGTDLTKFEHFVLL